MNWRPMDEYVMPPHPQAGEDILLLLSNGIRKISFWHPINNFWADVNYPIKPVGWAKLPPIPQALKDRTHQIEVAIGKLKENKHLPLTVEELNT